MPPPAMVAAVAVLALGYVPETGLDHLHLHVEDGHEFVHDHLHVGHHEHAHHHHGRTPVDTHDDHGGHDHGRSGVVSYAQAAQVRPPAIEIAVVRAPVEPRPWLEVVAHGRPASTHPPWSPRAPPA